jgi:two-component system copper resistance phosphate regulon response regulator CusR
MCHILCIEDDAETRVLIKKSLEAAGMTVDTVWGGEKGLEAAMTGRFDCVLLDVMMPGMDGYQVLAAIRAQGLTRALPVVMVTARDDAESRKRAFAAGVDGFVSKPFDLQQLIATIRELTGKAAGRPRAGA